MEARLRQLEVQLTELKANLSRLEAEVRALRTQPPPAQQVPEAASAVAAPSLLAPSAARRTGAAPVLALLGQSSLALGGAFLLRALSDAHTISVAVGVSLSLAFAWLWSWGTLRALSSRDRVAGHFRAATGACIAYPLLAETSVRGDLPPPIASLVLIAFTVTLVVVARRGREVGIAWLGVGSALGVGAVQVMTSNMLGYVVTTVVGLLLVTLLTEGSGAWAGLRWPAVLLADFLMLRLGNTMQRQLPVDLAHPSAAVGLAALLAVAPLAWVVWRHLAKGKSAGWFGWTQVPLAAAVGLVSAGYAGSAMGLVPADFAAVSGVLSAGTYGAALLDGTRGEGKGGPFLTSLAVFLALLAGFLAGGGEAVGFVGGGLGILSVWLGQRTRKIPLVLQGSLYLWLGAWAAGTLPAALDGLSGGVPGLAWPSLMGEARSASSRRPSGLDPVSPSAPGRAGSGAPSCCCYWCFWVARC